MKSMYNDHEEIPDSEYLFCDGILTIVCNDGVARMAITEQYDEPISLEDIVQRYPTVNIVIHEEALSGEVFRYNNYKDNEWWEVGRTRGYA